MEKKIIPTIEDLHRLYNMYRKDLPQYEVCEKKNKYLLNINLLHNNLVSTIRNFVFLFSDVYCRLMPARSAEIIEVNMPEHGGIVTSKSPKYYEIEGEIIDKVKKLEWLYKVITEGNKDIEAEQRKYYLFEQKKKEVAEIKRLHTLTRLYKYPEGPGQQLMLNFDI